MDIAKVLIEAILEAIFEGHDLALAFKPDAIEPAKCLLKLARDQAVSFPDSHDRYGLNRGINEGLFVNSDALVYVRLNGSIDDWEVGGKLHQRFIEEVAPGLEHATTTVRHT